MLSANEYPFSVCCPQDAAHVIHFYYNNSIQQFRNMLRSSYFSVMQKLQKFIRWGENSEPVRAMILSGSLAAKGGTDDLSDYDIAIFGNNFSFIATDEWLKSISD